MRKTRNDNPIIYLVNVIGQIIAFFTVILWLLCLLNGALSADNFLGYHFLGDSTGTLEYIKYWATLAALTLSGLELALKKPLFFIIYAIAVAGCVILMFFPGVFESLSNIAT